MFLWNLLSETAFTAVYGGVDYVLILVFVEFTLRDSETWPDIAFPIVLILVFVEFTLRERKTKIMFSTYDSLNPCFCGIYSQRFYIKVNQS